MQIPIQPGDRERVGGAGARLLSSIDPAIADRISLEWRRYSEAASRGESPPDDNAYAVLAAAAMRIVLQHVYQGFPLKLPQVVIDAILEAGLALKTPLFECEVCGYGLPRSFRNCPLCGGRVALGAYALRRGKKAASN